MNVDRRMRYEEGEYDAPVTPERLVFFQNVLGRTNSIIEVISTMSIEVKMLLTKRRWRRYQVRR